MFIIKITTSKFLKEEEERFEILVFFFVLKTAVATGQVLFHRYFYSSSFIRRQMEIVAMACTNLAAKIEENARRIRDVINVFHHIKQVRSGK